MVSLPNSGTRHSPEHSRPIAFKKGSNNVLDEKLTADPYPTWKKLEELVDEGKDISQTSAGQELDREIVALVAKHKAEMAEVQREMAAALAARDVQAKRELEEVRRDLSGKIEQLEHDRERISREYEEEKERAEVRLSHMEKNLAEEREARERRQKDIESLQLALEDTRQTSVSEREAMVEQINELEKQQRRSGGLFGLIGSILDTILPIPIRF